MLVLVLYVFFRVVIIALFLAALKYIELMLYGGLRLRTLGPAVRGRLRGQPDATPRGCGYSNERPSERRCPRSAPGARQAPETAPNAVRSSGAVYRLSISFYPVWELQQ